MQLLLVLCFVAVAFGYHNENFYTEDSSHHDQHPGPYHGEDQQGHHQDQHGPHGQHANHISLWEDDATGENSLVPKLPNPQAAVVGGHVNTPPQAHHNHHLHYPLAGLHHEHLDLLEEYFPLLHHHNHHLRVDGHNQHMGGMTGQQASGGNIQNQGEVVGQ